MKKKKIERAYIFFIFVFAISIFDLEQLIHSSEVRFYIQAFENAKTTTLVEFFANRFISGQSCEPLFWIISYLLSVLLDPKTVYIIIIICLWVLLYCSIIKSNKNKYFKVNLLILLVPNISFLYIYDDQIRNFAAIIFIMRGLLLDRNIEIYLSPFFHFSSLIIFPTYILNGLKRMTKYQLLLLIPIIVVFILFLNRISENFVVNKIVHYFSVNKDADLTFRLSSILILLMAALWLFTFKKKDVAKNEVITFWFLFFCLFGSFFLNRWDIFYRVYIYAYIFGLFILEDTLSKKISYFITLPISVAFLMQTYFSFIDHGLTFGFKKFSDFINFFLLFVCLLFFIKIFSYVRSFISLIFYRKVSLFL